MTDNEFSTRIIVSNDDAEETTLWIEPWAEEIVLVAGDKVEVEFTGPQNAVVVSHTREGVALHGLGGSFAIARRDGVVIWTAHQRVPPVP